MSSTARDAAATAPQDIYRVLLIDSQRLFRDGLRVLLTRERGYAVVGDTSDGRHALELVGTLRPHIVVTDLQADGGSSVGHLEEIRAHFPEVKVLVLTAFRAHDVAVQVRKAGALGYVLKDRGLREFLEALRAVAAGRGYRSRAARGARLRPLSGEGSCAGIMGLTERQRQVLRALALGYRTRETAEFLGVSVKAVHRQRERIREALRLDSIAALTRFAAREGFAEDAAPAVEPPSP